ncbi:MATE efflux family protein [Cryphonectria parasitica EP155]|uniref:MATE efflux family protein n=1 Tax=Cryphonectria parasitica (strain ATCC 38755 / EP155) TaxID=660469 RepID=A0A9P4Y7A4_CRYP1|nr:MATE efflux family protein [Cryphonectria parasitica EP155]KAF3768046.1 MATE efflux family protein [Cryphonectria parasitica EP155]
MYRRPSGVAYGTTRPVVGPRPFDEPVLTRGEWVQSRNEELSLLRDNHLLPPKHPIPEHESFFRRLYKRLFSTKVPLGSDDYDNGDDESQHHHAPLSRVASEQTPLLLGNGGENGLEASPLAVEELNEQWEAAVSAGQIKTTWQREAKTIAVYSRSLIVTFMLQYSINVASIFAVGHIGKIELGAISLATMTANITCSAPFQGLATSLDTLCAQAYGSGHKHLVGLQIQRMVCFLLLLFLPLVAVWLNATEILALMIPERRTAELAGEYLRIYLLGVPAFIVFEGGKRFVQAQGLFQATTYVLLIAAPFNVFLNWFFVWHLGWGFIGAPVSVVITQNLLPILLTAYVYFVDGRQCWGGFSRRALHNWGPMIRLSIPGMIMVEAEWFAFEILTLATGRLGSTYLATQSILMTITSTTFQIPFPIAIASSTRVANLIGAGLVDAARTCARVAFWAGVAVGILNVTLLATLRYQLAFLFTSDPDVIALVANVMPVCAIMQFVDCLAAISHGLLRGTGKQEFGGYANLACYYVVALPLAFGTAFGLGWKLYGLWFGVSVGLTLVSAVEFLYLYRSDWEKSVRDAERRNASA